MKKTLVILAEGFEEIEALTVVDVLRRAEVQCDMCSLEGEFVIGSHNITVKTDKVIDDLEINSYDAVVLPGGMPGSKNLKESDKVLKLVRSFNDSKKVVAAICAAPMVLKEAGILKDKIVTSYPGSIDADDDYNYIEEIVACDGNIITSRGPATSLAFSYKILEKLGLEEKVKSLSEGMMVNFYNNNLK